MLFLAKLLIEHGWAAVAVFVVCLLTLLVCLEPCLLFCCRLGARGLRRVVPRSKQDQEMDEMRRELDELERELQELADETMEEMTEEERVVFRTKLEEVDRETREQYPSTSTYRPPGMGPRPVRQPATAEASGEGSTGGTGASGGPRRRTRRRKD